MLTVTTTELKQNLEKYLALAHKESITITRDGVPVARLTSPQGKKKKGLVEQLTGIIPDDGTTLYDIRGERLSAEKVTH